MARDAQTAEVGFSPHPWRNSKRISKSATDAHGMHAQPDVRHFADDQIATAYVGKKRDSISCCIAIFRSLSRETLAPFLLSPTPVRFTGRRWSARHGEEPPWLQDEG